MQNKKVIRICDKCGGNVTQNEKLIVLGEFTIPKCEKCGLIQRIYQKNVLDMSNG